MWQNLSLQNCPSEYNMIRYDSEIGMRGKTSPHIMLSCMICHTRMKRRKFKKHTCNTWILQKMYGVVIK